MDNYFLEWKQVRSSKSKRISPGGVSIPVKLYYERGEKQENDFIEADNYNIPEEWQETDQIKIDTGENDK